MSDNKKNIIDKNNLEALWTRVFEKVKLLTGAVDKSKGTLQEQVNKKSDDGHVHDDRYYTETEIDTKIEDINESVSSHKVNKSNPHGVTRAQVGLGNVDNTSDINKPVSTAQQDAIDAAYANSNYYTDQKIAELINGAPTTLDTLKEIADAMAEQESVVEALDEAIGSKANENEFNSHITNKSNPHGVTASQVGALATNGDSKSNTVTFTSNDIDDASATSWTSVSKLTTGITHATFFQRVSQMFKNIRYLYKMLGTTDISKIGNGTITGALDTLNSNLDLYADFEEHKTPYTFLSKPIYRKFCKIDKIYCINENEVESIIYHPIADNIDKVWLKEGFYYNNNNGHSQPIPFISRVDTEFASVQLQVKPDGFIVFVVTSNRSATVYNNNSGYFIFNYTKLSD